MPTMRPPSFVGVDSAEELLVLPLEELLARFELLDEQRRPLRLEELPGRVALRTGQPAGTNRLLPPARDGGGALVGRAGDTRARRGRRGHACDQHVSRRHRAPTRRRAGAVPRGRERGPRLDPGSRADAGAARRRDRPVGRRLLHHRPRRGRTAASPGRSQARRPGEGDAAAHDPAAVSTRRQSAAPGLAGARGRRASPDRARRRSGAERRGSRRAPPRSLSPPRAMLVRRRPADRSRPHARDAFARHGRIGTAVHAPTTRSSRQRSPAGSRSASRMRRSTRRSSRRTRSSTRS